MLGTLVVTYLRISFPDLTPALILWFFDSRGILPPSARKSLIESLTFFDYQVVGPLDLHLHRYLTGWTPL